MLDDCEDGKSDRRDREMNEAVESPDSRVKGRLAGRQRQFEYLLTTAARLSERRTRARVSRPCSVLHDGVYLWEPNTDPDPMTA